MDAKPLSVGMIGTGWMGDAIAPDFALCDEVDLVAVAGRDAERTAAFAARHRIPKALDVRQLIEADEVELVYIASTHDSHFELAKTVLELGKPVLLEKAFTVDAGEAQRLIDLAESRGLFLMEAMWMRFNPVIRRVSALLAEGAIGVPRTLQASFGFAAPAGEGHRLWDPLRAGGSLLDQGVYPLALADLVFGEPDRVFATGSRLDYDGHDAGVDSEVAAVLGYAGGEQALCSSSIRSHLPLHASIGGAEGRIEIAPAFWCSSSFTLHRGGEPVAEAVPIEGRGYVPMLRATAEAVAAGRGAHDLSDHAATLRVMRTVDRVFAALAA